MQILHKSAVLWLITGLILSFGAGYFVWSSSSTSSKQVLAQNKKLKTVAVERVHPDLAAHSVLFEPEIIRSGERIYTAVGYGLANSHMIIGEDGVIIIDAMTTEVEARLVQAKFREISKKPVKALIYTHNHADHIFGSTGWELAPDALVIAHKDLMHKVQHIINIVQPAIAQRSARMFGTYLPRGEDGVVNAGIGPALGMPVGADYRIGLRPPTLTIDKQQFLTVAGIELEIYHAPGETDDQIHVWLPEDRAIFVGDNVYQTFPNLYTIRGTTYRDVRLWAKSVDSALQRKPVFLLPSHTRPVQGKVEVAEILTIYRDAIKFIHDQTVRAINRGVASGEIAAQVELPKKLREHPWLVEHYGRASWSSKNIFTGYMGWFSGQGVDLEPVPPKMLASRLAGMVGGPQIMIKEARDALATGEMAWAAQLAEYAMQSATSETLIADARNIQAHAFEIMGQASNNPNARHTYLTLARELRGEIDLRSEIVNDSSLELVKTMPISSTLERLAVSLNPARAEGKNSVTCFVFLDKESSYALELSNSALHIRSEFVLEQCELLVETNSGEFIDLLAGQTEFTQLRLSENFTIKKGSTLGFIQFLRLFQP